MTMRVMDAMMLGRASRRREIMSLDKGVPITTSASIIGTSISFKFASMSRAIKGIAAMVRGTMEAVVPRDVPTMMRVNGISATIKMAKGKERPMLTRTLKLL